MNSWINWSILWIWSLGLLLSLDISVRAACPRDVALRSHDCFKSYKVKLHDMRSRSQKLCCGIDVETLRAFCQSYHSARRCLSGLRDSCPNPNHLRNINSAKDSLDHSLDTVHELCSDDSIIEKYAIYQHCFRSQANQSEGCFTKHLGLRSQEVQMLTAVKIYSKTEFCNDMQKVMTCMADSYDVCGVYASQLSGVLSKPMIQQSGNCHLTRTSQQQTTRSSQGNPAYINAGGHSGTRQTGVQSDNSASSLILNSHWLVTALTSLCLCLFTIS